MTIRHHCDSDTEQPNIYRHVVNEQEVVEVQDRPGEDRSGQERSRVAIERTSSRGYVRVIYVSDEPSNEVFVSAAYELRGKALKACRRRRRRRSS